MERGRQVRAIEVDHMNERERIEGHGRAPKFLDCCYCYFYYYSSSRSYSKGVNGTPVH